MIRTSGIGRDGKVYTQTLDINGRLARKASREEVQQRGLIWTGRTYFFQDDGSYVDSGLVEALVNPETDPIALERRERLAKEDPINTSL